MAEELTTTETGDLGGQLGEGPDGSQTTQPGPEAIEGQSGAALDAGTTQQGTQQTAEDTFFDPQSIADQPELMKAYKQMQRSYGSKMEGIKAEQQKIDAFNAFNTDPIGTLQNYAKQYGYNLTRAEAAQAVESGEQTGEPQTWDEVNQRAVQSVLKQLEPIIGNLQQQNTELRKTTMEQMLDDSAPDWRQYEDKMTENLRAHPSLANDPVMLYRMSVPAEVMESRATQAALKKLQDKTVASQTSGVSTTRQAVGDAPKQAANFQEAVEQAKAELASRGISRPSA